MAPRTAIPVNNPRSGMLRQKGAFAGRGLWGYDYDMGRRSVPPKPQSIRKRSVCPRFPPGFPKGAAPKIGPPAILTATRLLLRVKLALHFLNVFGVTLSLRLSQANKDAGLIAQDWVTVLFENCGKECKPVFCVGFCL
jgi:hypothetical protein